MSDRIVVLIMMRIKYRFPDYSLARNANGAHYRYTNKENEMDKKLIQQLLDDDETRAQIAIAIGRAVDAYDDHFYDGLMINALNELNNTLVQGDMITIEVSYHMWVRGEYVRTRDDGKVEVLSAFGKPYTGTVPYEGKRVDLVVKDHEGETT